MRTKATNRSQVPAGGEPQPFQTSAWQGGFSRRQLAASVGLHLLGLLALGLVSAFTIPDVAEPEQNLEISFLSELEIEEEVPVPAPTPPVSKPILQPDPAPVPAPPPLVPAIPPLEVVEVPKPKPPEPRVEVVDPEFGDAKLVEATPPKREIRTDLFAENRSANASGEAPARNVQTGGFGNPEGVAGDQATRKPGARAKLGAFDLPAGPGQGNGTGGAQGVRGTVAGTGFGDQAATPLDASAPVARAAVRQAGFAETTAPEAPIRSKPRVVESMTLPVEIVSKPSPAYTDEARRKHLEGEVVLEVLFSADGRSQVLRVVSGLGSGLDESAVRAAEKILFKPARRNGQPVDYTTVVRILFQLA